MTLDQLKYFCATVEHGSVSEAAKQLNYSQPSLSIAIKKLEEELCVPLFTHGNRKLRLTKEGHFLYKRAKNILEQVDMVKTQMEEFNKLRNSIRFGISSMQSPFILPYLLNDFTKKYPDIRIEVHEDSTKTLREKLLQNKLDLAILVIDEKLSNK